MKKMKTLCAGLFLALSMGASASEHLITFVCTGNTGRSPMAEALSNDLIKKNHLNLTVESRGTDIDPKEIVPEKGTITVLKERGIDISSHKAAQLTEADIEKSDLLLTMTGSHKAKILSRFPQAKDKVFTLYEYTTGERKDLSDPYGKPLLEFQALEAQLDELLAIALKKASNDLK